MTAFDWAGMGFGALIGAFAGVLFFAGLAWGVRLALRARAPGMILGVSAALRIAALLGLGWLVAQSGVAALAGFALAFVALRFVAITVARRPARTGER